MYWLLGDTGVNKAPITGFLIEYNYIHITSLFYCCVTKQLLSMYMVLRWDDIHLLLCTMTAIQWYFLTWHLDWGKPEWAHSNLENGTVVHVRRTIVKNGIATHQCSFGTVIHVLTNTTSYQYYHVRKWFVVWNCSTSCTDIPY